MPKVKISEFSSTPGNNTDIDGINIAENCPPSGINDAIRELMAQLKDFQQGTAGDSFNGPVGTTTAAAGAFTTLAASGAVTLSGGTANGVPYLNGSKVLTTGSALTFDGSTVTNTGVGYSVNNANALLRFGNAAATRTGYLQVRSDAFEVWSDQAAVPMVFGVSNSEQMRLTSTGLGIGTSSPGTKLDVVGAGTFKVDGSGSTTPLILRNNNTASTQVVKLAFDSNGAIKASINAAVYNNDYMTFNVGSDTERMRLDSSGNLGLGVTPSAWYTSGRALQMLNNGILSVPPTEINVLSNAFLNSGASAWVYQSSNAASRYQQTEGAHRWFTAPSGTAGDAISFTQAMSLDASGNLLVGTTSVNGLGGTTLAPGYALWNSTSTNTTRLFFRVNGSDVGTVTTTGTSTAYNTSSDYRLKNITGPITTSGAYIDSLNPVEGTWKADGSTFVGLIAHEAQEASRTQVATGVKDGEEMQAMDYSSSEIIANMIAELKSLRARVAALETA